jgi:predicted acyltransferase
VYFIASLLYIKTKQKTQILVALGLLLLYWGVMTLIPVPGIGAANFERGTNFASWLDSIILKGHMWKNTKTWDPEGFLGTIPAIASGIIGMLVGQIINCPIPKKQILKKLLIIGASITVLGIIWNVVFPINKSIWTSSYVLFSSGIATLSLGVLYYVIEIINYKKWTKFFLIWGVNPMFIFFFSPILSRSMSAIEIQNPTIITSKINLEDYFYSFYIVPYFSKPMDASLAYAVSYTLLWSLIVLILHKNKLVFKV